MYVASAMCTVRYSLTRALEGVDTKDKGYRRYAASVERALASFDTTEQDWADYISFLGRLLKSLQTRPNDVHIIPESQTVSLRLAQCLSPALPSGVHQKALEVYAFVFSILKVSRIGLPSFKADFIRMTPSLTNSIFTFPASPPSYHSLRCPFGHSFWPFSTITLSHSILRPPDLLSKPSFSVYYRDWKTTRVKISIVCSKLSTSFEIPSRRSLHNKRQTWNRSVPSFGNASSWQQLPAHQGDRALWPTSLGSYPNSASAIQLALMEEVYNTATTLRICLKSLKQRSLPNLVSLFDALPLGSRIVTH